MDSDASAGKAIAQTNSTNSGNNLNWLFNVAPGAPILVSPTDASSTDDTTPTLSANYSDPDVGDVGTTNYRISTSSVADCVTNDNVIAWGASSETADEDEDTTWTPSSSIGDDATYYWCAQNNDGSLTSDWTEMGIFTLDTIVPTLAEVTAVSTPTGDTTPSYTFSSSEAGTISYGGDCSSATVQAVSGNNEIIFDYLSLGTYTNCTITVTDATGNPSSALAVSSFTVGVPGGGSIINVISDSSNVVAENIQKSFEQIALQIRWISQQAAGIFGNQQQPESSYPPLAESVPVEPQTVFRGGTVISKKELAKIAILPLPEALKNLALKFPQFAETLEKVGVSKPEDVQKLQVAKLTFPGLAEASGAIAGSPLGVFTDKEISQIPTGFVFAKTGADNIDFKTKVSFSELGEPIKTITTIENKPLYLVVKPDAVAETVQGYVIFKSANSLSAFLDFTSKLPSALSASLLDATNLKEVINSTNGSEEIKATKDIVLAEFSYQDGNDNGVWEATIQSPVIGGKYEIRTTINYPAKAEQKQSTENLSMIMVVDPEGYIFRKIGNDEARIPNATVSIYWLNPDTNEYELWPAQDFQQENPQTTDVTGKYSFLVPVGEYYLKATSQEYLTYQGGSFKVTEGSGVHLNIELRPKNWFWRLFTIERIMLVVVIILLASIFLVIMLGKRLKTQS